MAALQLLPVASLVVLISLIVATECMSTGKSGGNEPESSVTSYSTVVIHHPQGKKSSKGPEESRSQTYYKVKRVKTSTEPPKIHNFRPSPYYPESTSGESYKSIESDQSSENSKSIEQQDSESKHESEITKANLKHEDRSAEETTWKNNFRPRQRYPGRKQHAIDSSQEPEPQKETKQSGEESQENLEILRHNHKTKKEGKSKHQPQQGYRPNSDGQSLLSNPLHQFPSKPNRIIYPIEIPLKDVEYIKDQTQHSLTPLMTDELIDTLLSQQPQTFDTEKNSEPKKKSKSQNFKVGYSIGFGGEDVIVGKPKSVSLHINGKNSVWKSLPNGVEMSEEQDKKNALGLKIADSALKASDSVLKKDIYYMNNYKQDNTVPTTGRSTFDHAQAMIHSNAFDFSNAVDPGWYQQQDAAFDMRGLYQSLGYPSPLPVYLPGPQNAGSMVPAFVIPIQSLPPAGWSSEGHDLQPQQLHSQQLHPHQLHQQFQPQHLQLQTSTHQPHHLQQATRNHLQLQPSAHQALQQQIPEHSPFQLHSIGHQPIQLQSATNEPFHLVPIQFAHFVQMNPQTQQQQHVQAIPVSVQSKARVQQIQPTMQQYQRIRTPKVRDSIKQGTFESTPIVVATTPSDQVKLQQELNAILAEEMKRKNHRHPAVGLSPPAHPL